MYLCESNETVLTKLLRRNELAFEELFTAAPHVFINKDHPLAERACITLEELKPYPYLIFEQGERNSFYFAEELLSMLDMPKTIQVRDRATLFSLVIGLNGFTVSSGIIERQAQQPEYHCASARNGGQNAHRPYPPEKRCAEPLRRGLYRGFEAPSLHRIKLWRNTSEMYFSMGASCGRLYSSKKKQTGGYLP